jgi:glycosyltransferase involved in cell wall biosynthesis
MSSTITYPRLLVVCESPFSLDNGFGVTLTNLLEGWPGDRIGLLYTYEYQKLDRCVKFQALAKLPGGSRRLALIPFLLGLNPQWRGRYSRFWCRRVCRSFQPEIVYTFFHSLSTFRFGHWIAQQYAVPHVIHSGDDRLDLTQQTKNMVQLAAARYAISEPMAQDYQCRYGCRFEVLHNGAAPDYFPAARLTEDRQSVRVIRYLGSLHSWLHYDSLRLLRKAVDWLTMCGQQWNVELYGRADQLELEGSGILGKNVSYHGQVTRSQGIELLQEADLLVLPLTCNPEELKSYRFSFPTKLAEYLATGVPILLLSDADAASARFCRSNSVAHLIDQPSVQQISDYLNQLWHNPSSGIEQGRRNLAVARSMFDQKAITSKFQTRLASLARPARPCLPDTNP